MKILIAVPTYESIYPDTFKSIYELDNAGYNLNFIFQRGYDCAEARNRIALKAMAEDADYVLMVDNDMVLPSDVICKLLEDPKDVCIGLYAHRSDSNLYDGKVCAYKTGEISYVHLFSADEMEQMREEGVIKVRIHGGGLGCALIKTDIFRKLPYPWFDWVNYEDRQCLSEDLYFCEKLKHNNIPIYADTRVKCGHLLRHVQWPE